MKFSRDVLYITIIVILLATVGQLFYTKKIEPKIAELNQPINAQVIYNQDERADQHIIDVIEHAHRFVYFAVYTFTKENIRDALIAAKIKGLDVKGVTDKDQYDKIKTQTAIIDELRNSGIPVVEQDHLGIMHLKVVVTDNMYASGSYNWTAAATNLNDEVLEFGTDEKIRSTYQTILEKLIKKYTK